jgi:hypothetical protein
MDQDVLDTPEEEELQALEKLKRGHMEGSTGWSPDQPVEPVPLAVELVQGPFQGDQTTAFLGEFTSPLVPASLVKVHQPAKPLRLRHATPVISARIR